MLARGGINALWKVQKRDAAAEATRGLVTPCESDTKEVRGAAKIINYFLASFSPLWKHPSYGKA